MVSLSSLDSIPLFLLLKLFQNWTDPQGLMGTTRFDSLAVLPTVTWPIGRKDFYIFLDLVVMVLLNTQL